MPGAVDFLPPTAFEAIKMAKSSRKSPNSFSSD